MNRSNILAIVALTVLIGLIVFKTVYAQQLDIRLGAVYQGEASGIFFSDGLGAAGDINGDGYMDFLIGARFWPFPNGTGSSRGSAYIYLGGDTLPGEPVLIMRGEENDGVFGFSLHNIGDMNNDGTDDYAVFSAGSNNQEGKLRLYSGGDTLSNVPFSTMKGALPFQGFGVFTVRGDLNDDGYNDLIVAAPSNHALTTPPGRVFVYFGSDTFDTKADWQAEGLNSTWQFGINIGVGDLNGDGIDDLVVGEVNVEIDSGMVHIYYGGSVFDTVKDLTLTTSQSNGFGRYFAVGDITGDLIDDLVIYDFESSSYRIYFGGTGLDSAEDDVLPHNDWPPVIGDVNGDGVGDLLIGNNEQNSVDIFLGGSPFDHEIDGRVFGEGTSTGFSRELDYLGDVNGDGAGDFIAGAVYAGTPGATEGRAYLFLGDTSGVVSVEPDPVTKPKSFSILSSYPNPFNSSTTISYAIPEASFVTVQIYNIQGQLVSSTFSGFKAPGNHKTSWDGKDSSGREVASGIYIAYMLASGVSVSRKLLLLK